MVESSKVKSSKFGVGGAIHLPHSTLSQEAQDLVVAEFGAGLHDFVRIETSRENLGKEY